MAAWLPRSASCSVDSRNARVGVVVVPNYFDTTAKELQRLAPDIDVLHTQIRVDPSFGFSLEEIALTVDEISECAQSLAAAGADVVLQLGTPFSTVHGWDRGNKIQAEITDRIGVPFEMMGLSVPAGVLATGARSAALATTYYGQEWVDRYTRFATEAGIDVVGSQSFTDQGRFASEDDAWQASFGGFDPGFVTASILELAETHPTADAILVPGMPGRILEQVVAAEQKIDRPIVSYFAIWWRCLRHLGKQPTLPAGRLLDSLA